MPIHTVTGPIDASALGSTSMHEHVLIDASIWYTPPAETDGNHSDLAHSLVTMERLGDIRWNAHSVLDNLVLDDVENAITELKAVRAAGGSGIVDLTVAGLGPRPQDLRRISQETGLYIMIGCGWYIDSSHTPATRSSSIDELTEQLIKDLREGVADSGVLPAMIGEIGTSSPVTASERRCLLAAGNAAVETGASINVHVDPAGMDGTTVLQILGEVGVDLSRVVLSHLDEHMDLDYHLALASTGATLEYDTFGSEFYWGDLEREPTDVERINGLLSLIRHGHLNQLTLGCDIWTKLSLGKYGGMGYDHVLKRIRPALLRRGLSESDLDSMLIHTPRRLLARP